MSTEASPSQAMNSSLVVESRGAMRSWLLRRICSQNPFYLLSVCFVLHGTAHWFHGESGADFSPWPLLGLTAGYTLLLALTGFVIVRFGRVWDDARSILLIILLMFVQLSLIFDETLVRDPSAGRWLQFTGWTFSIVLSEALLRGLRIGLPWLYRLPYHALLALLSVYPLWLVSPGMRLPLETVSWRIFLFPAVAAITLLTLIPAIRRGSTYTKDNGTPWLWPWYPWSLFVVLGVCIGFRAYALCLSFDPVIGESLASAMNFSSAFGVYFLVPLIFAVGVLLLEIGLVENRHGTIRLAMCVPVICFYLSLPDSNSIGPYDAFLRLLTRQVGSPAWLTMLGAMAFYGFALVRRVPSAEMLLATTLLIATRVGSPTIDVTTLTAPQIWPFAALAAVELMLGLIRGDSHRVFVALTSAIAALHWGLSPFHVVSPVAREATSVLLLVAAVLFVGAIFRDEFAWSLRVLGAPLLVLVAVAGFVQVERHSDSLPVWILPVFVVLMTLVAFGYAVLVGLPLYRLSGWLCAATGSLDLSGQLVLYLIQESGWRGATSFAVGLGWFLVAVLISSWKAGWLSNAMLWLRRMLTLEIDHQSVA